MNTFCPQHEVQPSVFPGTVRSHRRMAGTQGPFPRTTKMSRTFSTLKSVAALVQGGLAGQVHRGKNAVVVQKLLRQGLAKSHIPACGAVWVSASQDNGQNSAVVHSLQQKTAGPFLHRGNYVVAVQKHLPVQGSTQNHIPACMAVVFSAYPAMTKKSEALD